MRTKTEDTPAPRLVDCYREVQGDGNAVRREYTRRWVAWHETACGRPDCGRHIPRSWPAPGAVQ